jgi:hypothetical protein
MATERSSWPYEPIEGTEELVPEFGVDIPLYKMWFVQPAGRRHLDGPFYSIEEADPENSDTLVYHPFRSIPEAMNFKFSWTPAGTIVAERMKHRVVRNKIERINIELHRFAEDLCSKKVHIIGPLFQKQMGGSMVLRITDHDAPEVERFIEVVRDEIASTLVLGSAAKWVQIETDPRARCHILIHPDQRGTLTQAFGGEGMVV